MARHSESSRYEQFQYWKGQLAGLLPALKLPTDRRRPANPTHRRAKLSFLLPGALLGSMKALGRRENVSLHITLLAAFKVLLYRYSGEEDIAVGSPIIAHDCSKAAGQIIPPINTLVMRTDLSGEPPFRQLLGRVREVTEEAYAHQDLPFDELVEELQLELEGARPPLFQAMFVFLENVGESARLPEPALESLAKSGRSEVLDLVLCTAEAGDSLAATLHYNPDLFDAATVERMASHFRTLLESVVADPDKPVSELPLLTAPEMHRLLVEWNDTGADFPRDACIHELFEAHVERNPKAVAVVCGSQELTYGQLNLRANQLAHHLRVLGVGPEVPVAIYMERSLEIVVGILGVLKAGGAYLPLDPSLPRDRMTFMLEDTQVAAVLTLERMLQWLPDCAVELICLDAQLENIGAQREPNLENTAGPGNLAYVIFTSGSTGQPKGVEITHEALVNHTVAMGYVLGRRPGERLLQVSSISFDVFASEVFTTLGNGATLVIPPDEVPGSAPLILKSCRDLNISTIEPPTSIWHALALVLEADDQVLPESFRIVCTGGERILRDRLATWRGRGGEKVRLVNAYGPTEATVECIVFEVDNAEALLAAGREVPIGQPISNIQAYVLDMYLNPVPIGVPGELCIAGKGLARGYRQRPGLTAECFVPCPYSDEPGARMYRTGDLACYLPDGNIEFLGRRDHQIKVRGFRVELNEIESVLVQHPDVCEAAVMPRERVHNVTGAETRLAAYLVPEKGQKPSTSNLRRYLRERLPPYMVPSAYVTMGALPLTTSDKLDRSALPEPDWTNPELDVAFVAPRTPVEEILADIWCQVLGIERIGIHDNFLDLGGHSLHAAQIVARVRDILQEVPLYALFESPTVAGMAAFLAQRQAQMTADRELQELLVELETLSEDEVERLLAKEGT